MLHNYISSEGYRLLKNEPWVVRHLSGYHAHEWSRREYPEATTTPRTWRQSTIGRNHTQTAVGRVRAAVAAAVGSHMDHATVGAVARQILKSARFTRIDLDNTETHLAFSPPGIKSHDMRGRRSLAFGRFLRRKCADLLKGRLAMTDTAVCRASAAFATAGATGGLTDLLSIARGEDAYAIYADCDNGISSCMSGKDGSKCKAKFIEHYLTANPEKIGVINARWNDRLILRAQVVTNDNGTHWLSRIYWQAPIGSPTEGVSRESDLTPIIESWCRSQGMRLVGTPDATLHHEEGEHMPYLDRCRTIDRIDDETIRLHPDGDYECDSTDGTDPTVGGGQCRCCACSERIDGDDARHTDNGDGPYCDDCYSERYSWDELDECDIDADECVNAYRTRRGRVETVNTHQDNCVQSSISRDYWVSGDDGIVELHDGDYCEIDEACYVESCDAYYLSGEVETDHRGDYVLADDCVKLHTGEYCLESDLDLITLHDGRYAVDTDHDVIETTDGQWALIDDCVEIVDDYGDVVYRIATDADVLQVA